MKTVENIENINQAKEAWKNHAKEFCHSPNFENERQEWWSIRFCNTQVEHNSLFNISEKKLNKTIIRFYGEPEILMDSYAWFISLGYDKAEGQAEEGLICIYLYKNYEPKDDPDYIFKYSDS